MEREKKTISKITNTGKKTQSLVDCIPLGHYFQSAKAQMYFSTTGVQAHTRIIMYNDPLCSKISTMRLLTPPMGAVLDTET